MESEHQSAGSIPQKKKLRKTPFVVLGILGTVVVIGLVGIGILLRPVPQIQMSLGDGRILQIEGVTFGTQHRMGSSSVLERFRPWLPRKVVTIFGMDRGANTITLDRPGLVVWVNAISAVTPTNVDCQSIRVEFVDRNGDLFGEETSSWFGRQTFWRVGHVFCSYPRDERELTLRVTTWDEGKISSAKIWNPRVAESARWSGNPLPQSKTIGDVEIVLSGLNVRTNGQGKESNYETTVKYFEPAWALRQNEKPASGWEKPEWIAEDSIGNRGQLLGLHQAAMKFIAVVYPQATNLQAAQLIASLPQTDLTALKTNLWWNKKVSVDSSEVVVLGLFLRGTHTFCEGNYESSSPVVLGPGGGASSGWTGHSQQINPMRKKIARSHYTPNPVIYICAPKLGKSYRLAVRLRDDHGQSWVAKSENDYPDEMTHGIHPFLMELPPGVTNVVPEVVLLKPAQADFLVDTRNYLKP